MRHHVWNRACAAVLALWFAIVTGAPVGIHPCPVHDGPAAPSASHAAHGHAHGASHHSQGHGGAGAQCHCIGQCCVSTGAAIPGALVATFAIVTVAVREAAHPAYAYVHVAAAHVLPFANGPPARAV